MTKGNREGQMSIAEPAKVNAFLLNHQRNMEEKNHTFTTPLLLFLPEFL